MLTQDAFTQHKATYTILQKNPVIDRYGNETNAFSPGGTIDCMFTPVTDEASIQAYGEAVKDMMQAVVYGNTEISQHDQTEIDGANYEFVSIKNYPSYRLVLVRLVR